MIIFDEENGIDVQTGEVQGFLLLLDVEEEALVCHKGDPTSAPTSSEKNVSCQQPGAQLLLCSCSIALSNAAVLFACCDGAS
jgi:hypothetical protein